MLKRSLLALVALLGLSVTAEAGSKFAIRSVQLDLARQKETVSFVKDYIARVKTAGFNTVVLYLEDRIRTETYPYPTAAESYSVDEMKEIVRAANACGIDLVPVVSPLGHAERFLRHPELRKFAEEREGYGRWGKCASGSVFCLEDPAARAWMEKYIREVAAIFPGKNFHFGFDETWNLGFCSRCKPLVEKDGLASLYLKHVLWAHDLAQKLGKRMWMWDDFFDFFPERLADLPKDILLCAWNYDEQVERSGLRSHFGGRLRRDLLRDYERLGIGCLICPWFRVGNVRSFTAYASSRNCEGALLTQWEMEADLHGTFLPRVFAAGTLWTGDVSRGDDAWLEAGVKAVYPSLDEISVRALAALIQDQHKLKFSAPSVNGALAAPASGSLVRHGRNALALLSKSALNPGKGAVSKDALSEAALLDDVVTRTEMALLCTEAQELAHVVLMPDRTASASKQAKATLKAMAARWQTLCARRVEQWRAWRGTDASKGEAAFRKSFPSFVETICARRDVASAKEWLLETDVAMADAYGAAKWRVEAKFADGWKELGSGVWKPDIDAPAYVPHLTMLDLAEPPSVLRLSESGYGAGEVCHISLWNATKRYVPKTLSAVSGAVVGAENLLVDDLRTARFGDADCTAAVLDSRRAGLVSAVELTLKEQ